MDSSTCLTLADLCNELELPDQFVLELAASAENSKHYHSYTRMKKSGGKRYINASQGSLKRLQRQIYELILSKFKMPEHVHGSVKGKSIVTNASAHVGKKVVVNIDLSDFFNTIKQAEIKSIFQNRFFFDEATAATLSQITTYKGVLPTGAPSSSALANIAALELDDSIISICQSKFARTEFGYSRYVDDITISGEDKIVDVLPEVIESIKSKGFHCNDKKTRILRRSTRQWVTGIVVNEKLNPPKKIVRKIRQALYFCKKWGLVEHCETHGINPYRFIRQINGYVAYLRLTQPDLADYYRSQFSVLWDELNPEQDEVTSALVQLKEFIDAEELAYFVYDDVARSVAPASITIDYDGSLILRGFELAPGQKWEVYSVSEIQALTNRAPRI